MINNNQEILIIIYCSFMLWINIGYLRGYKEIKEGLEDISSEDELDINPNHSSIMFLGLLFNFIRRWLIYLLAISMTENIVVILISVILFVTSLYDTLFNYSLASMKKSKLGLYLAIVDVVFIASFIAYLFFSL
ncbi:hypothetical protein [Metaplanococcus flavidus]|uniref:hypothetical protein n=1 Tax=Metaplanococcus flavidus TaxID=569883 RepID=UPI0036710B7A